jgi:hypothetical protein
MSHLQSCNLEQLCGLWSRRAICSRWDARQPRSVSSRCPHIYRFEAAMGIAFIWCKSVRRLLRIVRGMVGRKPGTASDHAGKGGSRRVNDHRLCSWIFIEVRKLKKRWANIPHPTVGSGEESDTCHRKSVHEQRRSRDPSINRVMAGRDPHGSGHQHRIAARASVGLMGNHAGIFARHCCG